MPVSRPWPCPPTSNSMASAPSTTMILERVALPMSKVLWVASRELPTAASTGVAMIISSAMPSRMRVASDCGATMALITATSATRSHAIEYPPIALAMYRTEENAELTNGGINVSPGQGLSVANLAYGATPRSGGGRLHAAAAPCRTTRSQTLL